MTIALSAGTADAMEARPVKAKASVKNRLVFNMVVKKRRTFDRVGVMLGSRSWAIATLDAKFLI